MATPGSGLLGHPEAGRRLAGSPQPLRRSGCVFPGTGSCFKVRARCRLSGLCGSLAGRESRCYMDVRQQRRRRRRLFARHRVSRTTNSGPPARGVGRPVAVARASRRTALATPPQHGLAGNREMRLWRKPPRWRLNLIRRGRFSCRRRRFTGYGIGRLGRPAILTRGDTSKQAGHPERLRCRAGALRTSAARNRARASAPNW